MFYKYGFLSVVIIFFLTDLLFLTILILHGLSGSNLRVTGEQIPFLESIEKLLAVLEG